MNGIYQQFFARSPLLALPVISLVIFVTVFALVLLRLWFSRNQSPQFEHLSRLPLDDSTEERHG